MPEATEAQTPTPEAAQTPRQKVEASFQKRQATANECNFVSGNLSFRILGNLNLRSFNHRKNKKDNSSPPTIGLSIIHLIVPSKRSFH